MKNIIKNVLLIFLSIVLFSCSTTNEKKAISAKEILGNPVYLAMSYGGYRENTRDIQPTLEEIKEDMKILSAMGIKVLRTYNTKLKEASTLLEAISQLKKEDSNFEMYVMLGAWIDCENAWTDNPNHDAEDVQANTGEIERAVVMANKYPDIVKIIAVGNEAMVHWAASYFVYPKVILKWVNHLQELKKTEKLPADLWITSSDNFASWGGGDESYHTEDLTKLLNAVDYVSLHTYPFHSSHYDATYWKVPENEENLTAIEKADAAMLRAKNYAIAEYEAAANYIKSIGVSKPIHIGETGWATESGTTFYGANGSGATDEYKAKLFYDYMRSWTNEVGMSCFYFEAFDEHWKDAQNPLGSENHFGLLTLDGKAKFALWDLVDKGVFKGLTRNGKPISKTYEGNKDLLLENILEIPLAINSKN
ncbi:glycosyl hydrolase family 17 [Lutibacter sp.]|uniref:glycosyl hydrolase family 17 n=1 Tax=Lutibacter sp. TaxID=1925666 RepID=UPI0035684088